MNVSIAENVLLLKIVGKTICIHFPFYRHYNFDYSAVVEHAFQEPHPEVIFT